MPFSCENQKERREQFSSIFHDSAFHNSRAIEKNKVDNGLESTFQSGIGR